MSTQNLSVWEKNGSLAEMFWKNGKGDFPVYDMHGHMGTTTFLRDFEKDRLIHEQAVGPWSLGREPYL